MPKSVSFIHTADLHLGRSFQDLGKRGSSLRRRIIAAFTKVIGAAIDRDADLILIAGDLFDAPAPPREALSALDSGFARLQEAGIKSVIMPGTHDPFGSRAFKSKTFTDRERHVHLLTPERPWVELGELDLAVSAWFPERERAGAWIGPADGWGKGRAFRVAMAHGSALSGLDVLGPPDMIPDSILKDDTVHYLALGHHHGTRLVAGTSAPAYYSGSPEILAFDQRDAGHALHVILADKEGEVEALVDRVRVGSLRVERIEVTAGEILGGRDLVREIEELADPDLYLEVMVEGQASLDASLPDFEELDEVYSDRFFKLRIENRVSRTRDLAEVGDLVESSVLAEFVSLAREKIEGSEGDERREWENALGLGIHFLTGGDQET